MRLVSRAFTCVLIAGSLTATAAHGGSIERIRPMQSMGKRLLHEGQQNSPTFRRLVDQLQQSDVIAYVDVRKDVPPRLGGVLVFLGRSATDRYVRITLNGEHNITTLVALLGHELQHAVEVAGDPGVTSTEALRALYHRIGVRTSRDKYDSEAAQTIGQTVRAELHEGAPHTWLARHAAGANDPLITTGSISAQ